MSNGWQIKTLGEVLQKTETVNPLLTPDVAFDYIDVSSVSNKTFCIEETQQVMGRDAPSRARKLVRTNDVLFATVRPTLRRIALVPAELDRQVCSTGYFVLRPKPILDNRFVFYFLFSDGFMVQMEKLQKGASYPAVTDGEVKAQLIPVPSLPEQQRIVGILDEAFDGIAVAKANTEKNLHNAHAVFDSYLESVFSRRGEGWHTTTIDTLSTNLDNRRVPITKSDRTSGEYPYYGASGIVDYVEDYIFDGDTLLISEDGANLLARATPIAFSVSGKYWVNNHAHILKFKDMATQRFVESYLESIKLDAFITGAAQPKLNQKALNSIPIPIPPLPEQQRIVTKLDVLREETRRLEALYRQKLAALDKLKKALLHQAFAGGVVMDVTYSYPELCPEKGYIFRITHATNVEGILQHGGLHCANAEWQDPRFVNIGNPELIGKRAQKFVPIAPGGTFSDYVPFYFTPFSMMMFNISTGYNGITYRKNEDIVIFVSSIYRLRDHKLPFLATNGHAYMLGTEFYDGAEDFTPRIDWKILQGRDFKRDEDFDKQQRYQAEVLVHRHVPLPALQGIVCYTDAVRQRLATLAGMYGAAINIQTYPKWYF